MADGHVGYVMPIGGVAAYRNQVSVVGVGFDIACGNAAIRTDLHESVLGEGEERARILGAIADEVQETVSFGVGRKNRADDAPIDHPLPRIPWRAIPVAHRDTLRVKARSQLGTVGSGNHYVDLLADESGTLWVGVHFGSRGFGHTVASNFLALGQNIPWGEKAPEVEVLLDLATPLGDAYWSLMSLAGTYAYAGREWVARKVVALLGAQEVELVHNHHNFAWKEVHSGEAGGRAKGATPAPGSRFVGLMGDNAVIVRGRWAPSQRTSTCACVVLPCTAAGARDVAVAAAGQGAPQTVRIREGAISRDDATGSTSVARPARGGRLDGRHRLSTCRCWPRSAGRWRCCTRCVRSSW
jgi:tRNA-splicing ligase RtcB